MITKTKEIIAAMLKENTGRHMCDSGGAYGRHWERNQVKDFENESIGILRFREFTDYQGNRKTEIETQLSLYHFLVETLEFDEKLTKEFEDLDLDSEERYDSWPKTIEAFKKGVLDKRGVKFLGSVNTYNGEDMLSQTIQYWMFEDNYSEFVILQIHNGCDVRGGYTAPKIFRLSSDYPIIFDNASATIYCEGKINHQRELFDEHAGHGEIERHYWNTDNGGYSFENQDTGEELGEFETVFEGEPEVGKIYVDEEGNGYCPHCQTKLQIGY